MGSKLGSVLVQVGHQAKTGIEFVFSFGGPFERRRHGKYFSVPQGRWATTEGNKIQ